jgi:hypothetical protein
MREKFLAFFLGLVSSAIVGAVSWLHELDTRVTIIETTQANRHDRNLETRNENYWEGKDVLSGLADCKKDIFRLQEAVKSMRDRHYYGR